MNDQVMEQLSLRLPKSLIRKLKRLAVDLEKQSLIEQNTVTLSQAIRLALGKGIELLYLELPKGE